MQRRDFVRGAGLVALSSFVLPARAGAIGQAKTPGDFASNHNYIIYGGGQPIRGLKVTLDFSETLKASTGVNMQLNAYAGVADENAVFQQYCMGLSPKDPAELGWSNENFPSAAWRLTLAGQGVHKCPSSGKCGGDIFNVNSNKVGEFPAMNNQVPSGAKLTWELINDEDGKVVGAIYSCEAGGVSGTSHRQMIDTFPYDGFTQHVRRDSMSPIYAFQVNIVALNGGKTAKFGGGAGRITYEAKTPLTALAKAPADVADAGGYTTESSNVTYSALPDGASTVLVQGFGTPFSGWPPCADKHATYNPALKTCEFTAPPGLVRPGA